MGDIGTKIYFSHPRQKMENYQSRSFDACMLSFEPTGLDSQLTSNSACPRVSGNVEGGLLTLPFSKDSFSDIIEKCHFPRTILRVLFRQDAFFSGMLNEKGVNDAERKGIAVQIVETRQ